MLNGTLYPQPMSAHLTSASAGFALPGARNWETPTASLASEGGNWPTPTKHPNQPNEGNVRAYRRAIRAGVLSQEQVKGMLDGTDPLKAKGKLEAWPTPTARDWKDTPGMNPVRPDGRTRTDRLPMKIYNWPTPAASDAAQTGSRSKAGLKAHSGTTLTDCVRADRSGWTFHQDQQICSHGGECQHRINPRFVEWLMGFPAGWVTGKIA